MRSVSVILPVYNSDKTIYQVLDSIYNQTAISNITELIIVDDGSDDQTSEIVKTYISSNKSINATYLRQDNQGVSNARNKGIKAASGDFIALVDSDDLWMPNKLERQLDIIAENQEIVFLGTGYFLGADKKEINLKIRGRKIQGLYKASLHDIYWRHFPVTPSVIFKRSAIEKVGLFDETQKYGEDINYFQKFCIHYNSYYYLAEPLVHVAFNKSYFGSEGLSANFYDMHKGGITNLKYLRDNGHFRQPEYLMFRLYFQIKYWRRIMLRLFHRILTIK